MTLTTPTTATLQTPPGRGGIAVITITGPDTQRVAEDLFHPHTPRTSPERYQENLLQLGFLRNGQEKLDEAIICTSEKGLELNIHGGSAVARRVLRRLSELGASVTQPDQADIFNPSHPSWKNPAIGQEMLAELPKAQGRLATSALTQQWSAGLSQLIHEAISEIGQKNSTPDFLKNLGQNLWQAAEGFATMRKLLEPAEVVLAGPPNAGKSTLANLLIGRPVSIVHDTAGTTRDWVRELAIVNGLPIWLTDTAGLWETALDIDAEAVRRAWQKIEQADLVLLTSHDRTINLPEHIHAKRILHIATKIDLAPKNIPTAQVRVSANTGEGMKNLKDAVIERLSLNEIDPSQPMAFTQRQVTLLAAAADSTEQNDQANCDKKLRQILAVKPG